MSCRRISVKSAKLEHEGYERRLELWLLRYVTKNYALIVRSNYFDDVCEFLGMEEEKASEEALKERLKTLEQEDIKIESALEANIVKLSSALNLSEAEKLLLEYAIAVEIYGAFGRAIGRVAKNIGYLDACDFFATIFAKNRSEFKDALKWNSPLRAICDVRFSYDAEDILDMDSDLAVKISSERFDLANAFESAFRTCDAGDLGLDDFDYIKFDLPSIANHLKTAKKGANVLLYGKPGTGKTEFVKAMAKGLGRTLYEVAYEGEKGRSKDGERRLQALNLAGNILDKKANLLLFDEVEDVFGRRGSDISKALINRTLEDNEIATLWVTNDIEQIDDAYIRRFDAVIEFPLPPRKVRERIIKRYANGLIGEKTQAKLAENKNASPALIANAAKMISNLKDNSNLNDGDKLFLDLIDKNLAAQGVLSKEEQKKKAKKAKRKALKKEIKKALKKSKKMLDLPAHYDTRFVNVSEDLEEIADGIAKSGSAKLCLYGPAGTGKSAFGKYIAKKTNRPLIIKNASDLLSPFVGMTEKNIAGAFAQAKKIGAVLVFGEADSFLSDRERARAGWERTQVNEMLTQMEHFKGIFVATTNLVDTLDKASARRFDAKIKFDYLTREQAENLFAKECEGLGVKKGKIALKLSNLTPGDFAAVKGGAKFNPIKDAKDFAARLEDEVRHKKLNDENE